MEDKKDVLEEERKVETSEKNSGGNKVLIVIIVILLLIIAVVFGYFLGTGNSNSDEKESDKVVDENKENEDSEDKEIQLEQLTKDSAVVKKLFETFREDVSCTYNDYWEENTESEAKKFFAYKALDANKFSKVKCGSLDDSFIEGHYCAMNDESMKYYGINETKYENAIKNETTTSVSANELEKKYKELYGKDAVMTNGDFYISAGPIAHYDKVNNIYAEYGCECGGDCAGITQTLDSITQNGTSLVLNTSTFANDDKNVKTSITYTFEYEKETGNYIFVSRVKK